MYERIGHAVSDPPAVPLFSMSSSLRISRWGAAPSSVFPFWDTLTSVAIWSEGRRLMQGLVHTFSALFRHYRGPTPTPPAIG